MIDGKHPGVRVNGSEVAALSVSVEQAHHGGMVVRLELSANAIIGGDGSLLIESGPKRVSRWDRLKDWFASKPTDSK